MDKLNLDAWVGSETVETGRLSEEHARRVHATLGLGRDDALACGDPMPLLWHWYAFLPTDGNETLGRDGHPQRSALLPPVHLERRMWAGGALTFHRPLFIGERIERRSRVLSVSEKMGKAGPMVLVNLEHNLIGASGLAVQERQDIVYLDIPKEFSPPQKRPVPTEPCERVETPETLLFRYSAITFNAHRIHYDLPYAREVEKYPELVVHGPLQATLLMQAATRHMGRAPLFFDFRGVHPMFARTPCDISMQENEEGLQLWAGQNGHQCMQALAVWEQTQ